MKPAFSRPGTVEAPQRACPSCAATMERCPLERMVGGNLELDICFDCHAIWFDQYESSQLAPGAVIELFRRIHGHHDQVARPLADRLACLHCRKKLLLTNDVQRTNRISYYRCEEGHGRLTTFVQFLREKNFVRTVSKPEIEQLKATVKQVRCSSCGAAVDLARDAACSHCRSPVAILDAEAVKRALAELDAKNRGRVALDPKRVADAMAPTRPPRREYEGLPGILATTTVASSSSSIFDLVAEGIEALFNESE